MSDLYLNQIMRFASRRGSVLLVHVGVVAARLVDAAGLFGHHIARDSISAGAGAAADVAKLTGATLAVELV
jgi:hypothetical protein